MRDWGLHPSLAEASGQQQTGGMIDGLPLVNVWSAYEGWGHHQRGFMVQVGSGKVISCQLLVGRPLMYTDSTVVKALTTTSIHVRACMRSCLGVPDSL